MRVYRTYMFRTKDPVIDKVRTAFQDHAKGSNMKERALWKVVEEAGGPKRGTLAGWFVGRTHRPQHATLAAALGAIGKEFGIVDRRRR